MAAIRNNKFYSRKTTLFVNIIIPFVSSYPAESYALLPEINTEITKPWAYGLTSVLSVGSDVEQSTESDQNILK